MVFKRTGFSSFAAMATFVVLIWCLWAVPALAPAEETKKADLPPRALFITPEYTGVVVPEGEGVSMDLIVRNGGRRDEYVNLTLTAVPKGWNAQIRSYRFAVTGVHVKSDSTKNLTFKAEPAQGTGPGDYLFAIKAQTEDGKLTSSGTLTVSVKPKEKEKTAKGVKITTSYPVLRGPTDAKFEFSLELDSKLDQEATFNLAAEGPKNWEISFKPAYEEKLISSLRVKAGRSETMAVVVKPPATARPGKYPIKVKVNSEKAQAEADLMVLLTGTYKLDVGTATGMLSLTALQGKQANLSFYVKNSGSATQNNVRFVSIKPENWDVAFTPEAIPTLDPGDLKQVEVTVTPAEQALVGDYAVSLSVQGERTTKDMDLRVTVKSSTAWGWIGIGVIILVIAGLVFLFVRSGRQ
ncbi:MAG: NEW3 domain-containing protein [Deltaproteobacteria bacterium]|jgi:uncharacterized membrane protein